MLKAREPAKSDVQEQVDETSSQGTNPTAAARYPKRALADDGEQGPPQVPQHTHVVRTRSGAHHQHRREPAAEASPVQEGANTTIEAGGAGPETTTNGHAAPELAAAAPSSSPTLEVPTLGRKWTGVISIRQRL